MYGSANEFLVKVCIKIPTRAKAPPETMAKNNLGSLNLKTILSILFGQSLAKISLFNMLFIRDLKVTPTSIFTEPKVMQTVVIINKAIINRINFKVQLFLHFKIFYHYSFLSPTKIYLGRIL